MKILLVDKLIIFQLLLQRVNGRTGSYKERIGVSKNSSEETSF